MDTNNTRKTRYLLASIVESSQDSIVSINLNRVVTSWNKGAEDLYGYKAEEVIGKPLGVVMLPLDIEDLIEKVNDIIHEVTVPIYETIRLHKNGKSAGLEILLSPVRDHLGTVIGISTVARDITLRKMQEQQKDEFITVASHELKTPITSIKAYTEILLERLETSSDEVSTSMIKKLNNQVNKLMGLIGVLLDTTKLVAGEIPLNPECVNLNELLNEQLQTFALVSNKHHFIFRPGTIPTVSIDKHLIGQVIGNIISNAVKYSPQGGDIIVVTSATDSMVEVSVQDFGLGIPAAVKEKIFERYFRVTDPVIASTSGLGLGLYITAGIVRQHGGTISLKSEEGAGTTFYFTVPNKK